MHRLQATIAAAWLLALPASAWGLPSAPPELCATYPASPACENGSVPACTFCHTVPPARNPFGMSVAEVLAPDVERPLDPATFAMALPIALQEVETIDSDDDGVINIEEILGGSLPGDPNSLPTSGECPGPGETLGWDPCRPDLPFTLRKLTLDVCGRSPTRAEREALTEAADPDALLDEVLATCLDTDHWRGREGVVWRLANPKIKPIQSIKSGEDAGDIPLADYLDDYNLFVYAHTDDRDVRDVLVADYHVARTDGPPTGYVPFRRTATEDLLQRGYDGVQPVEPDRRAGMITTRWFQMSNTMFTALPRTTAAQAYRAYLGYDISKLEGLYPVEGEPQDYDNKGVTDAECAQCHSTLDPLTYPFSRYSGIGGERPRAVQYSYVSNRPNRFTHVEGERFRETPESGWLFGQPVSDLIDWARVAANSDAFARATVLDYWRYFIGSDPTPAQQAEFDQLWRDLMTTHAYRVEAMLRDLVRTEAYRVP